MLVFEDEVVVGVADLEVEEEVVEDAGVEDAVEEGDNRIFRRIGSAPCLMTCIYINK